MSQHEAQLMVRAEARSLAEVLAEPPGDAVRLWWLGQAGFVIDGGGRRVVIDPYLSDSLAEKYAGTKFPHVRMMPAPVAPQEIAHVDLVVATHAHTDHLDLGTLPDLMAANPDAPLIAPRAVRAVASERAAVPPQRIVDIEAGETIEPVTGIKVTATRAAHEALQRDQAGNHVFLGMAVSLHDATIFHSGDTIPFEGQVEEVAALGANLALFPVNGRDAVRRENGVPGNMDTAEALDLAGAAGIPLVIAHHFGLFAFNTADPADIREISDAQTAVNLYPAEVGSFYELSLAVL
tara:strand:+ start:10946 stop:11824 length:879 start_codon:yes stop_codon:yes gene_type:complete